MSCHYLSLSTFDLNFHWLPHFVFEGRYNSICFVGAGGWRVYDVQTTCRRHRNKWLRKSHHLFVSFNTTTNIERVFYLFLIEIKATLFLFSLITHSSRTWLMYISFDKINGIDDRTSVIILDKQNRNRDDCQKLVTDARKTGVKYSEAKYRANRLYPNWSGQDIHKTWMQRGQMIITCTWTSFPDSETSTS